MVHRIHTAAVTLLAEGTAGGTRLRPEAHVFLAAGRLAQLHVSPPHTELKEHETCQRRLEPALTRTTKDKRSSSA